MSACQRHKTVCPPTTEGAHPAYQQADLIATPASAAPASGPIQVEIRGKTMEVDKYVDYPLCNDTWSGTVYVSCEAQVAEWDPKVGSRFLEGCDLTIDPEAVVYVAAHNDSPHYNRCSCHTGSVYDLNNR